MSKVKLLSESALEKKYKNSARADIQIPDDGILCLPSRCLSLNWQLGGGLFYGRIAEIFGYESTGKSLLAMDFAFAAQSLGGIALWCDAEGTWNNKWARLNGLDTSKVIIYDGNDIEGFSDWCRDYTLYYRSRLTKNEPILIVCDSIAALETLDNVNNDQLDGKAEMGNRAKALFRTYRYRSHFWKNTGATVLMINQVRKKVGASMWEAAETTPGGDATKFYATQRVGLNAGKQIKGRIKNGKFEESIKEGVKCGRNVYSQIHKNKMSPPRDSVHTQVYFKPDPSGYVGFSRYHGLPEILIELGVVKRKGNIIYYKDKPIAKGVDHLLKVITEKEDLRKILIKKSGINTISKTRAQMDALTKNLYPIKAKEADEESN